MRVVAPATVRAVVVVVGRSRRGGGGVRDILEFILRSQGLWDGIVQSYVDGSGQPHTRQ